MENEETFEGTLEEQLDKVKAALKRAQKEAKSFRTERDELTTRVQELESGDNTSELKGEVIKMKAEKYLESIGVKDASRVLKYLSLDGVETDEDGKLKGFEEKVNAVKTDLPELFDGKKRTGGAGDAFAGGHVEEKRDPLRDQVRRAMGNG